MRGTPMDRSADMPTVYRRESRISLRRGLPARYSSITPDATSVDMLLDERTRWDQGFQIGARSSEPGKRYYSRGGSLLHLHEFLERIRSENNERQSETIINVAQFRLPESLHRLANEIRRSEAILDLESGWDGEGSVAYERTTWNRAITFLVRNAISLYRNFRIITDPPTISPGPNGSIDLHWIMPHTEMLLNIPQNSSSPGAFYADNGSGGFAIRGNLNLDALSWWFFMRLEDE